MWRSVDEPDVAVVPGGSEVDVDALLRTSPRGPAASGSPSRSARRCARTRCRTTVRVGPSPLPQTVRSPPVGTSLRCRPATSPSRVEVDQRVVERPRPRALGDADDHPGPGRRGRPAPSRSVDRAGDVDRLVVQPSVPARRRTTPGRATPSPGSRARPPPGRRPAARRPRPRPRDVDATSRSTVASRSRNTGVDWTAADPHGPVACSSCAAAHQQLARTDEAVRRLELAAASSSISAHTSSRSSAARRPASGAARRTTPARTARTRPRSTSATGRPRSRRRRRGTRPSRSAAASTPGPPRLNGPGWPGAGAGSRPGAG